MVVSYNPRTVSLSRMLRLQVQSMIRARYHEITNGGTGMSEHAYRELWNKALEIPKDCFDRFSQILLVDLTIRKEDLARNGNFIFSTKYEACANIVDVPMVPDGKICMRYIAFVQLGEMFLENSVDVCSKHFAENEVGLVVQEGFHLPVQHDVHLRSKGIDLAGSRYGEGYAPYI